MREFEILNPIEDAGDAWLALSTVYNEIDAAKVDPLFSYSSKHQEDGYVYCINLDICDASKSTPEESGCYRTQLPILTSKKPQDEVAETLFTIYFHTENEVMEEIKEFFAARGHKELRVIDLDGEEYVVPLKH